MSVGVFISHASSHAEQVMALVDLLEAGLRLPDGAIACSSLPGYSVDRDVRAALESAQAVIAWVDAEAKRDTRVGFELGLAVGLGKWIVVVAEERLTPGELPWSLGKPTVVLRTDSDALRALVEDVGFQLQVPPRIGADAVEAIERVSLPPGAPSTPAARPSTPAARPSTRSTPVARPTPVTRPNTRAARPRDDYESIDTVPPPSVPAPPSERAAASPVFPKPARVPTDLRDGREDTQELELGDVVVANAAAALEAGRALSDCVFHRDEGGDIARELSGTFGRFIDSVGGEWQALAKLGDPDVWVEAAQNLLGALPPAQRVLADWYSLGFEFALLLNLSVLGVPEDAEGRGEFIRAWQDAAARFRLLATSCLGDEAAARVHYRLDSLIGPEEERDYSTVASALGELREHAARSEAVVQA